MTCPNCNTETEAIDDLILCPKCRVVYDRFVKEQGGLADISKKDSYICKNDKR